MIFNVLILFEVTIIFKFLIKNESYFGFYDLNTASPIFKIAIYWKNLIFFKGMCHSTGDDITIYHVYLFKNKNNSIVYFLFKSKFKKFIIITYGN